MLGVLVTKWNVPIFPPLRVVANYGTYTQQTSSDEDPITGTYIELEGSIEDIMNWVERNPEVWIATDDSTEEEPRFERWYRPH